MLQTFINIKKISGIQFSFIAHWMQRKDSQHSILKITTDIYVYTESIV